MRFAPSTPFPAFCTGGQISRRQIFQRHISRVCCQPPISPQFGTSDTFSRVKYQRKVFPPLCANKWINPLVICVSLVWLGFWSLWIHSNLSTTATFGTKKVSFVERWLSYPAHTRKRAREKETRTTRQDTTPLSCLPRGARSLFRPLLPSARYAGYGCQCKSDWAQLFERRLALTQGKILTRDSFFFLACEPREFFTLSPNREPSQAVSFHQKYSLG